MPTTTILRDTFTGTTGASLTGHAAAPTPYASEAWGDLATSDGLGLMGYAAGGGAAAISLTGNYAFALHPLAGSGADRTVTWRWVAATAPGVFVQMFPRRTADGSGYIGLAADVNGSAITLNQSTGGVTSAIGAGSYTYPFTAGTTYTVVAAQTGTTLSVTISDGTTTTPIVTGATVVSGTGAEVLLGQGGGSPGDMKFLEIKVEEPAAGTFAPGTISANGTPGLTSIPLLVTGATAGTGSLHYQWQRKPYGSGSFANVSGATSATLADSGLANSTSYDYRCNVTDDGSGTGATPTFSAATLWPVDDAHLNYTPADWYVSGSSPAAYAQTVRGGADVSFGFTGTSLKLAMDVSGLTGGAVADGVLIDGGSYTTGAPAALRTLATGLASGSHTCRYSDAGQSSAVDCWTTPANSVKVTGILLDPGAALAAGPSRPTAVDAFFGDSITAGAATTNGVIDSWGILTASALGTRPSLSAFSSSGWTVTAGGSNVPPFASALGNYSAGKARTLTGLFGRAFVNLGTNDGSGYSATIASDLTALRAALGSSTRIYHLVPFGGFGRADQQAGAASYGGTAATVTGAGTATYRSYANDPNYFLCDLGSDAETGITGGGASAQSADGVHPNTATQASLAAKVSALIGLIEAVATADGLVAACVEGFTAGLSTVGYRVWGTAAGNWLAARSTSGVREVPNGSSPSGAYAADVTIPGNVRSVVVWDSGEGSPAYRRYPYNPPSATVSLGGLGAIPANVVQVNGAPARSGDGTATAATSTTITIPSAANLAGWKVRVVSATAGADQVATIASSSTSTGVQTLGSAWATTPTGTIVYELIAPTPADVIAIRGTPAQVGDGTATAATSTTITIPSTSDLTGWTVRVLSATTGADQARVIASSNTGTGVQTLDAAWTTTPTGTIVYELIAPGVVATAGPVTLAASQPNYAPAKAGDAMALTSAYDPAKTAAQATALATLSTAVGTPAQASAISTLATAVGTPAQAAALATLSATVGVPAQATALSTLSTMVGTPAQAGTALSNAVWTNAKAANLDATVSSRSVFAGGSVTSVIGSVGSVTAPVTVGTNSDKAGYTVSTVSDKTGYALASAYDPAKTAAQASQIPAAFTSATFSSNGVFAPAALAAAPTGSGGSGSGATLVQLQGELDARGLTSTTTTRIDAAVSTRATASAVSSLATAVGSPAQSSALSTLATTIGTPTTTSIAADIQTRSTFGGGTVSANVVSINGVAARMGDGTASAVGSGSITIPSTADLKGWGVRILSATTGADQVGVVASSNTGTGVQTLKANWPVTPTGTVAYELIPPSMLSAYGADNVIVEAGYSLKDAHKVSLTADLGRCTGNGTTSITVGTLPAPTRNGSGTAIGATMADVTATINGQTAKVGEDRANTTVNLSNT